MHRFNPDEHSALEHHLQECDECRLAYAEYLSSDVRVSMEGNSIARLLPWSPIEARRRRFFDTARSQGLTFSHDAVMADPSMASTEAEPESRPRGVVVRWQWAAVAALVTAAASVAVLLYDRGTRRTSDVLAHLERENAGLREQLRQPTAAAPAADAAGPSPALVAELQRARENVVAAGARIAALEVSLRDASTKLDELQAQAEQTTADAGALRAKIGETEDRVAALNAERDRLIEQRAADATFMELQSARIDRLSEQMRERDQTLARQQELLGADRDIRDLMGARNLHVIDVFDVDGRGKTRRSFGRAFYTEGKSLIFYAFDLAGREPQRASFQAWGQLTADERSTQSLGILYSDDKAQNRWILKFDDPKVLAQIDSVFVTVEPPGGSARPSGQKLLYAYLRNSPNHP